VDTLLLVITKSVKWLLKNQHEITRAELAAEIISHTQRKTDRVTRPVTTSLMDPHAGRRVAIQQLGEELTHAAIGACVPTSCVPGAASRQEITLRSKI
jgi:hypothetical protein